MKQVSIREFRANMNKHLSELPFELMKNGKVVGKVVASNTEDTTIHPPKQKPSTVTTEPPVKTVREFRSFSKAQQVKGFDK